MEHHHISSDRIPAFKCIDIYLDHEAGIAHIVDSLDQKNRITISAGDWNELVDRIRSGKINQLRQ